MPEAPHPVQLQAPPDAGCGPNCTELPGAMLTLAVCCQVPALTRRYGVIAVGVQPPLDELDELLLDDELLLEDELEELVEPVVELDELLLELEEELLPQPVTRAPAQSA